MGHVVKIGRYEIIDADLNAETADTISIPCQTNPGLSYQLDGWDEETSVPAWIDGKPVDLEIGHYDKQQDRWILKKPA
ncbi:MAG: DUF1480 family protein [Mixta calida]|jgi:hypothetical protein|uniref:DUF1480 domain-containing protein n=1 Tax=Mixta calida TaxID=665913 RepID=A0ABN5HCE3_9GAMM|nr:MULTISPECIES: DUF1480 family protein [Mixta]AIX73600.1 hypothetical protein PSNIH2_07265 [Pantoea sp. PSNIH2]MBS6057936.1 DUF1480 family protein [Pantoea sp.]POU48709.1 DUF1480 domain-containing protein [Pantoea sp. PSNIH5]POU66429.1 DUF1480 domain-containing protein [Pantoea sp. PSNIH4]POY68480.1 DUF1480 domain-containing protein [Pantoea sp. PSNIH3]